MKLTLFAGLVTVAVFALGAPAAVLSADPCGGFFYLPISHNDGFGDVAQARELAVQLQARNPGQTFPVIVRDRLDYRALSKISAAFRTLAESNDLSGVEIVCDRTERAADIMARPIPRMTYLPAGNVRTSFDWGDSKLNLYYDESGVPRIDMEYVRDLPRGQVIERGQNYHIRINPGFAADEYGVALPRFDHFSFVEDRKILLESLARLGSAIDPRMVRAKWGIAYSHSQLRNESLTYYQAIFRSLSSGKLVGPVVVFDFSVINPSSVLKTSGGRRVHLFDRFRTAQVQVRTAQDSNPWIGAVSKKSLTIVRPGLAEQLLFLSFMRQSDLAIAVTGTQSLLEATSLRVPFVPEFVPWNLGLNFGLAEFAALHYDGDERRFLLDWILGKGDLDSVEKIRVARHEYGASQINFQFNGEQHVAAIKLLLESNSHRQLLVGFLNRIRERDILIDRLQDGIDQLRCRDLLKSAKHP